MKIRPGGAESLQADRHDEAETLFAILLKAPNKTSNVRTTLTSRRVRLTIAAV